MNASPALDCEEMESGLRLLHPDGEVFEVRVLEAVGYDLGGWVDRRSATIAGYFDNPETAAIEIMRVLRGADFKGVYQTLNPINPALLARAANRLRRADKMPLTGDADVLSRRWIPIDADPVRPSGISATEDERNAALDVLCNVVKHLAEEGWPDPFIADSGNGFHGGYRINLPVADGSYVQRLLR